MNLTTHLFGDSFLADWTKDKKPFPLCNDYIDWEKTRGNHDIEDIPYWLNKFNHSNVKNYAKGGSSNDSIFESLEENYDLIQPGDLVVLQTSIITRLKGMHKNGKKWFGDIFFNKGVNEFFIDKVNKKCFFDYDFYTKLATERLQKKWVDFIAQKINFYEKVVKQKNAKFLHLSIDLSIVKHCNSSECLLHANKIAHISPIDDYHPSYEGNKSIATYIVNS